MGGVGVGGELGWGRHGWRGWPGNFGVPSALTKSQTKKGDTNTDSIREAAEEEEAEKDDKKVKKEDRRGKEIRMRRDWSSWVFIEATRNDDTRLRSQGGRSAK